MRVHPIPVGSPLAPSPRPGDTWVFRQWPRWTERPCPHAAQRWCLDGDRVGGDGQTQQCKCTTGLHQAVEAVRPPVGLTKDVRIRPINLQGVHSILNVATSNMSDPKTNNPSRFTTRGVEVAERTRLELAASGVTGRRYNRLNYRSTTFDGEATAKLHPFNRQPRWRKVCAARFFLSAERPGRSRRNRT